MKKILITGGCGFFGHHLVEHILKNTDWHITILDGLTYAGNLNRVCELEVFKQNPHRITFTFYNIRLPIPYKAMKYTYVIHLAAETHVDNSMKTPKLFAETNIIGTIHLLEWLRICSIEKCIIFSTDEVFGSAQFGINYKEDDPHKPSNPYSASKSGQEAISYSYGHSMGLPIIITRCMNLFGERQHPEKFVPKTIKAILEETPIILHGTDKKNTSLRHWIHCREAASAILFILLNGTIGEAYHIPGIEYSVQWIAQKLMKYLNTIVPINYLDFHRSRPGHDFRYSLDGSKLAKLGWEPSFSVEKALKIMATWYLKNNNKRWLYE